MYRRIHFAALAYICVLCLATPTNTLAQTYLQLNPTANQTVTAGNTNIVLNGNATAPNALWGQHFKPFYQGWNLGNNGTSAQGWSSGASHDDDCSVGSQGIQHCYSGTYTHYGIGDTAWSYIYGAAFGGMYRASDEGVTWQTLQGFQMPYISGPIASGGTTGSSLISVTPSAITCAGYCIQPGLGYYFSQGGYLLDTSQITGTATLSGSSKSMNAYSYTLSSGTVSVSTAWGNIAGPASFTGNTTSGSSTVTSVSSTAGLVVGEVLTGAGIPSGATIATIGVGTITLSQNATITGTSVALSVVAECWGNGNGQSVVSTTCNISLGTSPASPGNFTTGSACMVGPFYEQVQITSAPAPTSGIQTITFNTNYAWNNSNLALLMQGGVCGQAAVQNPSWPVAYPVIGATSSSQIYVANCIAGLCNQPALSIGGTALFTNAVTLTRAGGTVTMTYTNGGSLYSMPTGTTVVVAGFSPADLNGTFTVASNTMDETYGMGVATWAQTGSNETGTGGSISLPYNTATFYPMAVISGQNSSSVFGEANLLYNTVPFSNGDTVMGAPTAEYQQAGFQLYVGQHTANDDSIASRAISVVDQGPSHPKFLLGLDNNENSSPNETPGENAIFLHGSYSNDLFFYSRPANNGSLLHVNGTEVFGTNPKHYEIFSDSPGVGIAGSLGFDPNTGLFDLNGSKICTASNGQCPGSSGTLAVTSGGTGTATAPAAGNILVAQSTSAYAPEVLSGDCSLVTSGAITCTKTNGTSFGTMATQNASAIAVTGGAINGTVIGGTTPAAATFTGVTVMQGSATGNAIILDAPLAGTNAKMSSIQAFYSGFALGGINFNLLNDDGTRISTPLSIYHSGVNPSQVQINADLIAQDATFSGTIVANSIQLSGGVSVTGVAGAAAGSGASASVVGLAQSGVLTVTTGTSPLASGQLATISFSAPASAYTSGCSIMARNAAAAGQTNALYTSAPTSTGWNVQISGGTLAPSTQYAWSYICF